MVGSLLISIFNEIIFCQHSGCFFMLIPFSNVFVLSVFVLLNSISLLAFWRSACISCKRHQMELFVSMVILSVFRFLFGYQTSHWFEAAAFYSIIRWKYCYNFVYDAPITQGPIPSYEQSNLMGFVANILMSEFSVVAFFFPFIVVCPVLLYKSDCFRICSFNWYALIVSCTEIPTIRKMDGAGCH